MSNAATIAKLRSRLGMPAARDAAVYVVISKCLGAPIAAERDVARMNRNDTIADIASGEIENVVSVFAMNVVEGWSEDVSEEIAMEIAERDAAPADMLRTVRDFVERHTDALPALAFEPAR